MMELETCMAGLVNGIAALIAAQYPLALYSHCVSHCLNLAVVKSLQVTSVCNMMGVVDKESICNDGPCLWTSDSVTDARTLQLATRLSFCTSYDQHLS